MLERMICLKRAAPPRPVALTKDKIMAPQTLSDEDASRRATAPQVGVTEGADLSFASSGGPGDDGCRKPR